MLLIHNQKSGTGENLLPSCLLFTVHHSVLTMVTGLFAAQTTKKNHLYKRMLSKYIVKDIFHIVEYVLTQQNVTVHL